MSPEVHQAEVLVQPHKGKTTIQVQGVLGSNITINT